MHTRGDSTVSPFVIGFIFLLAGFILLAVTVLPKLFGTTSVADREACHLSVLARASLPVGKDAAPLQCSPEKICITGDLFGECDQFAGETGVRRVRVDGSDVARDSEVIEREIANAMLDCWNMMGEGKVDIVSKPGLFEKAGNTCVVCTRVAIDASTVSDSVLREVNVNDYLLTEQAPGSSLKYIEHFLDKGVASYTGQSEVGTTDISAGTKSFASRDLVVLFSQIRTTNEKEAAKMVALGGLSLGAGGLLTSSGRAVVKTAWPLAIAYLVVVGVETLSAYQTALEGQAVAMGYCGEVKSSEKGARAGCSLVKTATFEANAINAFCTGGLEGNL